MAEQRLKADPQGEALALAMPSCLYGLAAILNVSHIPSTGTRILGGITELCGSFHIVSIRCKHCNNINFFAISGVSEILLGMQTIEDCLIAEKPQHVAVDIYSLSTSFWSLSLDQQSSSSLTWMHWLGESQCLLGSAWTESTDF